MKRPIILNSIFVTLAVTLFIFGGCTSSKSNENNELSDKEYKIVYVSNGAIYKELTVHDGGSAENVYIESNSDYTFGGWNLDGKAYNFSQPVSGDITLFAEWLPTPHAINFVCDGKVVGTDTYTIETVSVTYPHIPEKEHFKIVWDSFTPDGNDITLHAVYKPIEYPVIFYNADGSVLCETTYNYFDNILDFPELPPKHGYEGGEWIEVTSENGIKSFIPEYNVLKKYSVTFISEDIIIASYSLTLEEADFSPPRLPEKPGYTAQWEDYIFDGDTEVHAIYTPIQYDAEFYADFADGDTVKTVKYTVEDTKITEPEVPPKDGYTNGRWEEYSLSLGGVKIHAVYDKIIVPDPTEEDLPATEGLEFTLCEGFYTVTGYSGTDREVVIPSEHNGLSVKEVGISAFYLSDITKLTILNGVEYIGQSAFMSCFNLEEIYLPKSLTVIDKSAFASCRVLKTLNIPSKVTAIKRNTFTDCTALKEIIIPDSIETIDAAAFKDCVALENILIGDGTTFIDKYAFKGCSSLLTVTIGANVSNIEAGAFDDCPNIVKVYFKEPSDWYYFSEESGYNYIPLSIVGDPAQAVKILVNGNPVNIICKNPF